MFRYSSRHAGRLLQCLVNSAEVAGLSDFSVLGSEKQVEDEGKKKPQIGDWVQWEHNRILGLPQPKKLLRFSDDGLFGFVEGSVTGLPVSELIHADPPEEISHQPLLNAVLRAEEGGRAQGAKMRQDVFSLAEGEAVIHWPTPLSADSIADLEQWLDLLKRKIKRSTFQTEKTIPVDDVGADRDI